MSNALILPGVAPSGALELFFHSLTAWPPAQPCTLYLVGFDALPPAAPADSVLVPAAGGYSACLAAGLTAALAKAEHTHFCLLHADTVLSPGWLDDLLAADADAVGPVTNFARTSQQLAGAPALRQNRFSVGKAADWAKKRRADFGAQPPVKAEQLSAFCLLLTRSAAQAVAGLPADLPDPALAEQGISLLLRQKGFSMVCCRGRYLHHWGGESRRGAFPRPAGPAVPHRPPPAAGHGGLGASRRGTGRQHRPGSGMDRRTPGASAGVAAPAGPGFVCSPGRAAAVGRPSGGPRLPDG